MAEVTISTPTASDDLLIAAAKQVSEASGAAAFADPEAPTVAEAHDVLADWAENALEELITAVDANAAAESARQAAIERANERKKAKRANK